MRQCNPPTHGQARPLLPSSFEVRRGRAHARYPSLKFAPKFACYTGLRVLPITFSRSLWFKTNFSLLPWRYVRGHIGERFFLILVIVRVSTRENYSPIRWRVNPMLKRASRCTRMSSIVHKTRRLNSVCSAQQPSSSSGKKREWKCGCVEKRVGELYKVRSLLLIGIENDLTV